LVEQDDPSQTAVEGAAEAAGQAIEAMLTALVAFLLVLVAVTAQAIRALLLVAPALLKAACIALPIYAAASLYPLLARAYSGDVPATLLAGAVTIYIPAALFTVARTWGALMLAGVAELGLMLALPHAPPLLLALAPVIIIAAVTLHQLSAMPTEAQEIAEGEQTNEQVSR
jgi:hypothetical protein